MDSFISSVVDVLISAGIDATSAKMQACRAVSEIEQTMEDEETLRSLFERIGPSLREACEAAVGTRIDRMLIAPIPRYLEPFLPRFIEVMPEVVLADNSRAGQEICGYQCISLGDALASPYDAYFLGTFMGHLAKFFLDQFPIPKTIGTWELRMHAHFSDGSKPASQSD
jgi:hypothetical protein